MIPRLIELGPLPINSFGLCIALAAWAGIACLSRSFLRAGIKAQLGERYVLWGIITGLLGARTWYILNNWSTFLKDPFGELFSGAGFIFYGGFFTAATVLILLSRRDKIPLSTFLDSLGPTLAIGYGIGRLGCQLAGDGDYGIPTTSIFGMAYPEGVVPTPPGVTAFPTPIYESIMAFTIAAVLLRFETRGKLLNAPYARFGLYLVLISFERFIIEFFRRNPHLFGTMFSQAQFFSVVLIVVGGLMVLNGSRKTI